MVFVLIGTDTPVETDGKVFTKSERIVKYRERDVIKRGIVNNKLDI